MKLDRRFVLAGMLALTTPLFTPLAAQPARRDHEVGWELLSAKARLRSGVDERVDFHEMGVK
jgi:hypothetical protein